MSQSEDQLDWAGSGGPGITDLVFDHQNQERFVFYWSKRDGLGGFATLDYRALMLFFLH